MDTDTAEASPALETLINTIDEQVNLVHGLAACEGFAAILGGRPEDYQHAGEKYVRFIVNGTTFAIPLKNTLEIDYVPDITPLPNLPEWVLGICNLRGDIVSVVDLQKIFNVTSSNAAAKKVMLIRNKDVRTAIVVDAIAGIRVYHEQDDQEAQFPPEDSPFSKFVKHTAVLGRRAVCFLDLDALMAAIKI
jgi:purine-binding chemotaxis protein CheW